MPGCAVHLEIADRLVRGWDERPDGQPFAVDDPACRRAFLFGSLGPDLGYFPGGDGLLADLAHCVRSSQLARNLLKAAVDDAGRALAWGWITHVLADVAIHPLINEAAAERIHGIRRSRITYAENPGLHMRIELGLDALLPVHAGWREPKPARSTDMSASSAAAIASAYAITYGITPSLRRLHLLNRLAPMVVNLLLSAGRVVSGRPTAAALRWTHRAVAGLTRRFGRGGIAEALTNPFAPAGWLLDEAAAAVDSIVADFPNLISSGFEGYPDYNLDTGEVEGEPPTYPLTVSALRQLAGRLPSP